MTRLFLALAMILGVCFAGSSFVGCGEQAAVNKPTPKDPGVVPKEDQAEEDAKTVDK